LARIRSNVNKTDEDTPTQKVASQEAFPSGEDLPTKPGADIKHLQ